MRNKTLLSFFIFLFASTLLFAQRNRQCEDYIRKYSAVAQDQMRRHKVPASITLAQGIVESGAGRSRLAVEANNHFGIKCHDWKGKRIYHDDDALGECFRRYGHAQESFEDHSLFLVNRSRYARLFKLDMRDYTGWAKGLQLCGYATDKAYANKLIKIIEDYELYKYDNLKGSSTSSSKKKQSYLTRTVYRSHGLLYVIAKAGDSYTSIAQELDFKPKRLASYNEFPVEAPLKEGDVVYLEKKNKKYKGSYNLHEVKVGESMHSISQKYGLRMKYLYKLNKLNTDYLPVEGDILRVK